VRSAVASMLALSAVCLWSPSLGRADEPAESVEEVSLDDLDSLSPSDAPAGGLVNLRVKPPATEHGYQRSLLALPLLLIGLLAWNVRWNARSRP
jgi:hypothetical protein